MYDLLVANEASKKADFLGLEPPVVAALQRLLPTSPDSAELAIALGQAWLEGRRSAKPADSSWVPVASGRALPRSTFPRVTGETLIGLIGTATDEILVATAYLDGAGVRSLSPSLRAAAGRGVSVRFAAVDRLVRDDALRILERNLHPHPVEVIRLESRVGFPHLKVLIVDSRRAYLGSANFTQAGMSTNLELGALVEGTSVEALRAFVELLLLAPDETDAPGA